MSKLNKLTGILGQFIQSFQLRSYAASSPETDSDRTASHTWLMKYAKKLLQLANTEKNVANVSVDKDERESMKLFFVAAAHFAIDLGLQVSVLVSVCLFYPP